VTSCTSSPTLPTGLGINGTTCVISGTPTVLQSATNYTITATNSSGSTITTISIAVLLAPPSSLSYSGSPYTFTQNISIASQTPIYSGSVTSCTSSPALPTGLGINGTTCVISGTPSVVQSATNYTITATNSSGSTTATISITVNIAPPSSLSYSGSPYTFTQNVAISAKTPTFSGSVSSCTSNPTLPTGLGINGTTCVISGTPSVLQSANNYTITATNSSGSTTATISIAVLIAPPSSLSYSGSPYSFTQNVAISAMTPTYSGSITSCTSSPTLPTGLGINGTTCVISGAPTVLQSATNYTITATNSSGSTTATINIAILLARPTSLSYSGSPFTFTQNISIASQTPTYSGSVTSCTSSPALPTGLGINGTTCVISGTPIVLQSATNYVITATNPSGSTSATISIGVNIAPPSNINYSDAPFIFTQNNLISPQIATISGSVTSCNSNPPLPSGLNINNVCTISGTPNTVQYNISYTITATNSSGSTSTIISISTIPSFNINERISTPIGILKTGQTTSINVGDDGNYEKGNIRSFIVGGTTGLIWQRCSYGLSNTTCSGSAQTLTWSEANSYCYLLGTWGLTWRLPTINEFMKIYDFGMNTYPPIDSNIFPNFQQGYYWAQDSIPSTYINNSNLYAYKINFGLFPGGSLFLTELKTNKNYTICVTGKSQPSPVYIDNGNGTISDTSTGLIWQKCLIGQNSASCSGSATAYNWDNAILQCEGLNLASRSDWRLPNINELGSIVDRTRVYPSLDDTYFINSSQPVWSSTFFINSFTFKWIYNFHTGSLSRDSSNIYVRCVTGP
jgi:hypothetical protein